MSYVYTKKIVNFFEVKNILLTKGLITQKQYDAFWDILCEWIRNDCAVFAYDINDYEDREYDEDVKSFCKAFLKEVGEDFDMLWISW